MFMSAESIKIGSKLSVSSKLLDCQKRPLFTGLVGIAQRTVVALFKFFLSMSAQPSSAQAGPSGSKKNRFLWSEDLNDFLGAINTYDSTLPEAVSTFYLEKSGMAMKDPRIAKLVSLAADKLLLEIVHEAKQISQLRQQSVRNQKRRTEMADTLELADLEASLAQSKIMLRRKRARKED